MVLVMFQIPLKISRDQCLNVQGLLHAPLIIKSAIQILHLALLLNIQQPMLLHFIKNPQPSTFNYESITGKSFRTTAQTVFW